MLDKQVCKAILKHLKELRRLINIEEPRPIFIFQVESKIRAYRRKLERFKQK